MREPVVSTTRSHEGIALVGLEDREHKNTFSPALVEELLAAFRRIEQDQSIKVVVVHGYDNYFCSGGNKQELLRIIDGEITFDSLGFYRLLLDCPVPTIAAMQGHAIGGGLAFACYADLMVIAEESLYTANFMKFGFTPGMGSTYIVPLKFGLLLGTEMLFTAKNYQGGELKKRGLNAAVVRRTEVIPEAMRLARELAEKPRSTLVLLKQKMVGKTKQELDEAIRQELEMHRLTLSHPSVREKVEAMFGG